MSLTLTHAWILTGAWNFAALGAAGAIGMRRNSRSGWTSLFFLVAGISLAAISLAHQSDGLTRQVAWRIGALIFLIGPALYGSARALYGAPLSRLAAIVHLAGGTALGLLYQLDGRGELLLVQLIAYAAVAARARTDHSKQCPSKLADAMIAAASLMAVAQAARVLNPQGVSCNLALMAGAVGSAGLLLLVLGKRQDLLGWRGSYAKAGLSRETLGAIWARLENALQRDHLYRRPQLSLAALAAAAGVTAQQASQAISQVARTSFSELIAAARVEDAKQRLRSPHNQAVAVEPLGMEAGFRSRSAFYAAFKKATGLTPGDYRDRYSKRMS